MKIILASESKIRKRAMDLLGIPYNCIPANIDEKSIRDPDPFKMALKLSEAKAKTVGSQHNGIVIASDAFLIFKGKILEKPLDIEEAKTMLKALSGSNYCFVTGLAVYDTNTSHMQSTIATCNIYLRKFTDIEIDDYISRYPVLNYAGAHETDAVVRFSEKVEGNCNFFTALPMNDLIQFLRNLGVGV